jgi:hypothetical protein
MTPGVRLTKEARQRLRFYTFFGAAVLALRNWSCTGGDGSNGSFVRAWAPRGTHLDASGKTRLPNSVIYAAIHTPGNWSVEAACRYFKDAARKYQKAWRQVCHPGREPVGTRYERGRSTVRIAIPARRYGSATIYAGGPNPTVFQVWWVPAGPRSAFGDVAATAVCALPKSMRSLCNAVLADVGVRFRAAIKPR